MKSKWVFLSLSAVVLFSCGDSSNDYEVFGSDFENPSQILSAAELEKTLDNLEIGDTAEVVFQSTINAVCQKKGCWMDVDLGEDFASRVTFLDYGFFVPLNASGSEAIVKGKAFWKVESMQDKKHYAEDAGEEFNEADHQVTEDEYEPHIVATGVKIKKTDEK